MHTGIYTSNTVEVASFVHIADELVAVAARINVHREASCRAAENEKRAIEATELKNATGTKREWIYR